MQKIISKSGLLIALGTLAAPAAYAHSGEHSVNVLMTLMHFLTQPDHLLMVTSAIAITYIAFHIGARRSGRKSFWSRNRR